MYAEAVRWAASEGIVTGVSETLFAPDEPITREQFAAILWRYAKYKGYDVSIGESTNILSYRDFGEIGEYAIPALQWACGAGIIPAAARASSTRRARRRAPKRRHAYAFRAGRVSEKQNAG